jgi:SH3-like domain-containing protein
MRYRYICDNTKKIVFRRKDIVPWFYVHVNYMGKDIELDCSLNRNFMSAARIRNTGKDFDYKMEHYYCSDGQAFKVLSEERKIEDVNAIDKIFQWVNDSILQRAHGEFGTASI